MGAALQLGLLMLVVAICGLSVWLLTDFERTSG